MKNTSLLSTAKEQRKKKKRQLENILFLEFEIHTTLTI